MEREGGKKNEIIREGERVKKYEALKRRQKYDVWVRERKRERERDSMRMREKRNGKNIEKDLSRTQNKTISEGKREIETG